MPTKKPKPIVEYRNYYLPSSFPVLLLTGDNWKISDVRSEHLHFHNCMEVGICHTDSGTLEFCSAMTIPFSAGDITCIPRNIPHTTYSARHTKSRWSYLFFDPRLLFRDMLPPDFNYSMIYDDIHKYLIPAGASRRIILLAEAAVEELSAMNPYHMLVKSYLFALYMEIIRFQSPETQNIQENLQPEIPPPRKIPVFSRNSLNITPALDFIEDNYMNKFPVDLLAELCHMSPTHFRRNFQSAMHMAPLAYLNTIRIMNACNLLRNTNHTILTISEMTGFSTLSNFNRHFNQMMKMSPKEYRRQTLKGRKPGEIPSVIEYAGWLEPDEAPCPKKQE